MPRRDDWQNRIKDVGFEFQAVCIAMERLVIAVRGDPTIVRGHVEPRYITCFSFPCRLFTSGIVRGHVEPRYITRASDALEGTYLTRMFAEFETGLRLYWVSRRVAHPRMVELLNSLAAQRGIPDAQRDNAHLVREFRNSLVHEREDEDVEAVSIATARSHLCHFFSFLPLLWADV